MISFTSRGITRSRYLTLSKFIDPLLEPLAVLNPWAPALAPPEAWSVESAKQEQIHAVLSQIGMGFGQDSEKGWET